MNLLTLAIAVIIILAVTLILFFIFERSIKRQLEEEKYYRRQLENICEHFHREFVEHMHKYH